MRVSVAAVALASAAVGFTNVWPYLGKQLRIYGGLSATQAAHAPAHAIPLPADVFDFYRAQLRPRERFYILVHTQPAATDRPLVVRSYAWYWLGPAIELGSPAPADVVLGYEADPSELGFRPARLVRMPGRPSFFVAFRKKT